MVLGYHRETDMLASGGLDSSLLVWNLDQLSEQVKLIKEQTREKRKAQGLSIVGADALEEPVSVRPSFTLNPYSELESASVTGIRFLHSSDPKQVKLICCNAKGEFIVYATDGWRILQTFDVAKDAVRIS